MRFTRKKLVASFVLLIVVVGVYFILNRILVIDRTDQVIADYEFGTVSPDVEAVVEGTGKQMIKGDRVSTNIRILTIITNKTNTDIDAGSKIEANEYFVVYKSRYMSQWHLTPGRSLYGMGTGYKHLGKDERRTVYLKYSKEKNEYWILPDKLVEK